MRFGSMGVFILFFIKKNSCNIIMIMFSPPELFPDFPHLLTHPINSILFLFLPLSFLLSLQKKDKIK